MFNSCPIDHRQGRGAEKGAPNGGAKRPPFGVADHCRWPIAPRPSAAMLRSPMKSVLRHRLLPLWLGLVLLLTQQLSAQHALTHAHAAGSGLLQRASAADRTANPAAMPAGNATADSVVDAATNPWAPDDRPLDGDSSGNALCALCLAQTAVATVLWPALLCWASLLATQARPDIATRIGPSLTLWGHQARGPPSLQF